MTIHPRTKRVWVTEMGRDLLGDDLPPDEINIIDEGGNYGWPFCYGKNVHDGDFDPKVTHFCREPATVPSSIDIPAHSAPLGLAFFPDEGWPKEFRNDLLVAYHGSWNRSVPTGYKIVRYRLDSEGRFQGVDDFISGWLASDGRSLGRPVDIMIRPEGTIFVSDDKARRTLSTGSQKQEEQGGPIKTEKNVIIIGAGASGLLCAVECGKRGRSVLVIDHRDQSGSKIRISGGGRSNFTNLNASADHYLSQNPHFCKSALARFTPRDILALVEKHHIAWYEKEAGQIFCVKSSRDIISMLEKECEKASVETRLNCRITDIGKDKTFTVHTSEGIFTSESLVIATGGLSYPKIGASGFGHEVARQFGLRTTQVRPALVPFVFSGRDQQVFQGLAGVSLDAALSCGAKKFRGSVLFTHRGLSGPAALQASLYWISGAPLIIDLLPATDILEVFTARRRSKMEMRNLLAEFLPKRFAQTWCDFMLVSKPVNETSDKELKAIADGLHRWEVFPKGTEGYNTAEVTAGGVDTDELSSKTMEAKKAPGLYFIGEVVDVTGELGGYNLHWAWASGFAAGQYA